MSGADLKKTAPDIIFKAPSNKISYWMEPKINDDIIKD